MSNTPTIIIVPGSWHCPKHYKYLIDGLAKFNYEAVGVTLPSVNSSPPHASWDQDAQAVREVIMKSLDSGNDVILVAHSFGGVAMSEAVKGLGKKAREEQGLKGGVVRLIYMCAMALPEGQTHVGQIQPQTPEEEELERQRQELQEKYGGMRFTEDGAMLLDKEVIRDVFYNRCDPKDVDEAVDLLGSFPTGPLTVPVTYTAYREIPSTYIVCENDKALPVSYQERMIAQGDGVFHPNGWTSWIFNTLAAPVFKLRRMSTIKTTTDFPDILLDTARPARHHDEIATSLVTHRSGTIQRPFPLNPQLSIGGSPSSPLYLLNSKLNATILDGCLARIHDTIVTGCASRFIGYECNLYKPACHYQLGDGESGSLQDQKPVQADPVTKENLAKTPTSMSQSDVPLITPGPSSRQLGATTQGTSHKMTIMGAVRFLDHFSDLYGNRLTVPARRKSDAVLKAVLRTFSLQWLSPNDSSTGAQLTTSYNNTVGRDAPRDLPIDIFYDSWFQARSLINSALPVQSFRVIYAMLMFDGISIPAKATGETLVAHEFLEVGLQKLNCLTGLVDQYCMNLGPQSTYGAIMEASLSVVRWCAHVRDIGAALTANHICKLSDASSNEKGQEASLEYELMSPCSFHQSFNQDFDNSVPDICRTAVAEAFRIWKRIVSIKGSLSSPTKYDIELCPNQSMDIISTITAVGKFREAFGSFLDFCIGNLEHLSMRSRLSSVSILMFWNLGVFVLKEALKPTMRGIDPPCSHSVFLKLQAYSEEAALSVTQIVERVLSLPFEEIFNLQNGVSGEASVLSYHITPTLVAATFQKAIENILDVQLYPPCGVGALDDRPFNHHADSTWKQHIDTILKGLISLDATIGGSQTSGVAIRSLMQSYGDIISECWSSDFKT
ncbi:Alpha/beta hydrolase family-domain-containing protein [Aspergillus pseudonomiae]|uniref:Alpha/beta hydrolase family-domain-containing protein n=1 Tax=Aspergillus pseudonomiae TaxID=1506151 RepID=A0A5N7DTH9_9EURO|nr:Alpha/beta hydrolase family-domain-containing protein [Aspergillus pseudonomiae]KAE8409771.1 Alpha/beta hydrolase family-domain-containing protein [Aspergillus pseudonomiae]